MWKWITRHKKEKKIKSLLFSFKTAVSDHTWRWIFFIMLCCSFSYLLFYLLFRWIIFFATNVHIFIRLCLLPFVLAKFIRFHMMIKKTNRKSNNNITKLKKRWGLEFMMEVEINLSNWACKLSGYEWRLVDTKLDSILLESTFWMVFSGAIQDKSLFGQQKGDLMPLKCIFDGGRIRVESSRAVFCPTLSHEKIDSKKPNWWFFSNQFGSRQDRKVTFWSFLEFFFFLNEPISISQ